MNSIFLKLIVIVGVTWCVSADTPGRSTRYWDCCKPSCGWAGKAPFRTHPVNSCQKNGRNVIDVNAKSGCEGGGTSFMCANQQPWAINDNLAYGFAAVSIAGQKETNTCCACYELTFTSGPVSGKKMIVQATNSGGDLGQNHFDIQIPGGGVGIFNGCAPQYGAPGDGWGSRYGGVSNDGQCGQLPGDLQAGCHFRFNWFRNADNPSHNFHRVKCPRELTDRTGCVRSDE